MHKRISLTPQQVRPVAMDSAADITVSDLNNLGVFFNTGAMESIRKFAVDEAPAAVTIPSVANALQFLQYFFARPITIVTQARRADDVLGRTIGGSWEDAEVVVPVVEHVGQVRPYGDANNVPLASFNNNFEARSIFRMELGLEANRLEMLRSAKMRLDSVALKRDAIALAMSIGANDVAFNGYNDGSGHTYGLLNDPGLSAYVTVSTGANSDTVWSGKTFAEITADIRTAVQALQTSAGGNFDPQNDEFTFALALDAAEALSYTTDFGMSVYDFIEKNYPKCRVVKVPQFNAANGGENVFYLIAGSIAGNKVAEQVVQAEFYLLGTAPTAKGMIEDYSNATAGTIVTQPIGVVRFSGI